MALSCGNETQLITMDDILDYRTELDILNFYLEVDTLPAMILSPLREDRNPSFKIDYNENGSIRYHDFGTRQSGDVFTLIMEMYKIRFNEALSKIYNEMIKGRTMIKLKRATGKSVTQYKPTITDLKVKVRKFRQYDLDYWAAGGITQQWLEFGDVYPITHIFITKDEREMCIPCDKLAYAYVEFKDGKPTYKIYQPLSETHKWLNKHDKSVWDMWTKLPATGDKLIITSSRKDALTIWANCGIPATSLQAESLGFKSSVIDEVKSRFKTIYLLYDNDFGREVNYGRELGFNLAEAYGFKQIEIPDEYKSKDSFDLRKSHGATVFKEVINKLINQ